MKIQERYMLQDAYKESARIIEEFQQAAMDLLELYERCWKHRRRCKFEQMSANKPEVWAEVASVLTETETQVRKMVHDLGLTVAPDQDEVVDPEVIEPK